MQGLKCVRENSVVPPGLESLAPLFPALPRWLSGFAPAGLDSRAFRPTRLPED